MSRDRTRRLGDFTKPGDEITMADLKEGEFGYIACHDLSVKGTEAFVNLDVRVTRRAAKEAIRVQRVGRGCHITFVGFNQHRWFTDEPAPGAVVVLKITSGGNNYNSWDSRRLRLQYTSIAEISLGSIRYVLASHIYDGPRGKTVRAGTMTFTRLEAGMVGIQRLAPDQYQMRLTRTGRWQPLIVED